MGKVIKFDNGLRLVNNYMPSTRAVSIGIFVGVGSSNEEPKINGISHYIEHMMFKGTEKRSAFEIAESIDSIGGQINAFTSKQMTAYYTVSVDEHAEECMEILSDLFINSKFDEEEMKKEKGVVLEEISMVEDNPSDLCLDLAIESYYGEHSYAYPILGTRENVKGFTREDLKEYIKNYYVAENIVISIAGNMKPEKAKDLVEKYLLNQVNVKGKAKKEITKVENKSNEMVKNKDIEQANVAIVFPGLEFNHKDEVAMLMMSSILGGGMSSILFQKIREEHGLAYSVYGYPSAYIKNGTYTIYYGANKDKVELALTETKKLLENFKKVGVSDKEFARGKEQLKGALVLGQESSSAIMNANGKSLLMKDKPFSIDDRLESINNVTKEDINKVINKVFDFKNVCLSYVGPKLNFDLISKIKD